MPKHKFWLVMSFLRPGAQRDLSENLHIPGIREKSFERESERDGQEADHAHRYNSVPLP